MWAFDTIFVMEGMKMGEFKFISTLASVKASEVILDALFVIAIGMIVVFIALILLTAIFWLFGKFMQQGQKTSVFEEKGVNNDTSSEPHILPEIPVAEAGISEEVVAVISAAVAAMSADGKRYTVRRVRRVVNRPVWAAAGIAESTRPF